MGCQFSLQFFCGEFRKCNRRFCFSGEVSFICLLQADLKIGHYKMTNGQARREAVSHTYRQKADRLHIARSGTIIVTLLDHSFVPRVNLFCFFYFRIPPRPIGERMDERSRFSRRFINVKNVLRTRAFKSSLKCNPLVATLASLSPFSVIKLMIWRCRSCGVFPNAVSRRISEQLDSSDSVKCNMHCRCSASGAGTSCLQPDMWQGPFMIRYSTKKGDGR